ncbi:MAG: hypothetical protein M3Y58_19700 [Chloroflexota bacterium]|nr:hypothetical protein [Chloroflexota bacterium]
MCDRNVIKECPPAPIDRRARRYNNQSGGMTHAAHGKKEATKRGLIHVV